MLLRVDMHEIQEIRTVMVSKKWGFWRRKVENVLRFQDRLLGSLLAQSAPGYVRLVHFYFSYTLICAGKQLEHRKSVGERSTRGVGSLKHSTSGLKNGTLF